MPSPPKKDIKDFIPWYFEKKEEPEVVEKVPERPPPSPIEENNYGSYRVVDYKFDDNLWDDSISALDIDFEPETSSDFEDFADFYSDFQFESRLQSKLKKSGL